MGHAVHPVHEQIRAATFACGGDVSLRVYAAGECVNVFLRKRLLLIVSSRLVCARKV